MRKGTISEQAVRLRRTRPLTRLAIRPIRHPIAPFFLEGYLPEWRNDEPHRKQATGEGLPEKKLGSLGAQEKGSPRRKEPPSENYVYTVLI